MLPLLKVGGGGAPRKIDTFFHLENVLTRKWHFSGLARGAAGFSEGREARGWGQTEARCGLDHDGPCMIPGLDLSEFWNYLIYVLTVSVVSRRHNPGQARREQGSWKKTRGAVGTADILHLP